MKFKTRLFKKLFRKKACAVPGNYTGNLSGRMKELEKHLDHFMAEHKSFLMNQYNLGQLSEDSGIPVATLSDFIEYQNRGDYDDLINRYRIRYCQSLLQRMPKKRKFDIFDLCIICGFTDEKEFSNAFRKVIGRSIQGYIKRLSSTPSNGMGAGTVFILLLLAIAGLHIAKYNTHAPNQGGHHPTALIPPHSTVEK